MLIKKLKNRLKQNPFDIIAYLFIVNYLILSSILLTKFKTYWIHFYNFYVNSIFISQFFKLLDFEGIKQILEPGIGDKILYLLSLPFFVFLKPNHYLFFLSKIIFNTILFIILYMGLKKITSTQKSFLVIVLTMTSSFFIIETLNSYVNSTWLLISGCFFVYLMILIKEKQLKNLVYFIFISTLFFLTKTISFILIPFIIITLFLYFLNVMKKKSILKITAQIGILIFALFISLIPYFWIYNFHITETIIGSTSTYFQNNEINSININWNLLIKKAINSFSHIKWDFLKKFSWGFSVILYISVVLFRKNNKLLFYLFLMSEIYLFVVDNFSLQEFQNRFIYGFHIIYLLFISQLISKIIQTIHVKIEFSKPSILSFFLICYILVNISITTIDYSSNNYSGLVSLYLSHGFPETLFNVPYGSKIYFLSGQKMCISDFEGLIDIKDKNNLNFTDNSNINKLRQIDSNICPRLNFSFIKVNKTDGYAIENGSYLLLSNKHVEKNSGLKLFQELKGSTNDCQLFLFIKESN